MCLRKKGSKVVAALVVAGLLAAGWFAFKPEPKPTTTATKPTTSQTTDTTTTERGADPAKLVAIETADFKYEKQAGWAEISPILLESTGAASGIGRPTEPVATFSIKVSSSVPKDNNDLKNSTLNELKKFTNFQLTTDTNIKVDNQSGQRFVYNYTDSEGQNKSTQQMDVVVYKQKTFFLLFSSSADDYSKQTKDFDQILKGFQFK